MNYKSDIKKRLSSHDVAIKDNKAYFSTLTNNGLYVYDILGRKTEYILSFDGEVMDRRHLYGASMAVKDRIYFAPMNASKIAVYDITSGDMRMIDIHEDDARSNSKYYGILKYKDKVLLIPSRAKHLAVINTKTLETEFYSIFLKDIEMSEDNISPIVKNGSFIKGDYLYLPLCRQNGILKILLNDFSTELVSVNGLSGETGFSDASFDEETNELWLLSNRKTEIIKTTITCEYSERIVYQNDNDVTFPYINMIDMGERIFLPAYQAEYSLVFNKTNREFIKTCFGKEDYAEEIEWNAKHYTAKKISDSVFCIACNGNYEVLLIDAEGNKIDSLTLEDEKRMQRMYMSGKSIIRESIKFGLSDFLEVVAQ